jgi:hypothetical protein
MSNKPFKVKHGLTVEGDISVTGTLTGTVDGRDVAVDGAKLDGIATSANNYSLPKATANDVGGIRVGANLSIDTLGILSSTDTNTETTTTLSVNANTLTYTDEVGGTTNIDLSLYIDDTNLARLTSGTLNGTTGVATFTRDDSTTFTLDLSGLLDTDTNTWRGIQDNLTSTSTTDSLSANQGKWLKDNVVLTSHILPYLSESGGTLYGDLKLGDNVKATFGAGNDLQIYSNGTHSFIKEVDPTGHLYIQASNLLLESDDGKNFLYGTDAGVVHLYHNDSARLSTTSTGIDVTGSVRADKFQSGSSTRSISISESNGNDSTVIHSSPGDKLELRANSNTYNQLVLAENGNVGIYHTSPSEKLEVNGNIKATAFVGDGSALTGIVSIPTGLISMWSGAASAIPSGWNLCDGSNGTPNLVGKFIKGGSTAGATGGSTSTGDHTLTTAQMPSHTHTSKFYAGGANTGNRIAIGHPNDYRSTGDSVEASGGGGSHSHTLDPVHYTLCYIIKT